MEAKVLLSTITDQPEDVGQGEAVLSLLSGFPIDVQAEAIVLEIPRFEREGQHSWSESIVETEARFRRDHLIQKANDDSSQTRAALRAVLERVSAGARSRGAVDIARPVLEALRE